mmetsp:Transcript_7185/g.22227  ORF Transcript_7185/g.22227 Transcript_7185/m.22227 type:complete len:615 (-) Transcript_7185:1-1845(-)
MRLGTRPHIAALSLLCPAQGPGPELGVPKCSGPLSAAVPMPPEPSGPSLRPSGALVGRGRVQSQSGVGGEGVLRPREGDKGRSHAGHAAKAEPVLLQGGAERLQGRAQPRLRRLPGRVHGQRREARAQLHGRRRLPDVVAVAVGLAGVLPAPDRHRGRGRRGEDEAAVRGDGAGVVAVVHVGVVLLQEVEVELGLQHALAALEVEGADEAVHEAQRHALAPLLDERHVSSACGQSFSMGRHIAPAGLAVRAEQRHVRVRTAPELPRVEEVQPAWVGPPEAERRVRRHGGHRQAPAVGGQAALRRLRGAAGEAVQPRDGPLVLRPDPQLAVRAAHEEEVPLLLAAGGQHRVGHAAAAGAGLGHAAVHHLALLEVEEDDVRVRGGADEALALPLALETRHAALVEPHHAVARGPGEVPERHEAVLVAAGQERVARVRGDEAVHRALEVAGAAPEAAPVAHPGDHAPLPPVHDPERAVLRGAREGGAAPEHAELPHGPAHAQDHGRDLRVAAAAPLVLAVGGAELVEAAQAALQLLLHEGLRVRRRGVEAMDAAEPPLPRQQLLVTLPGPEVAVLEVRRLHAPDRGQGLVEGGAVPHRASRGRAVARAQRGLEPPAP